MLDPFCGSGTTSTVARAWNRRSIAMEQSETIAASAWERITELGMVRKGESQGKSSAIHAPRAKKPKTLFSPKRRPST